jgi:hypothetical protein
MEKARRGPEPALRVVVGPLKWSAFNGKMQNGYFMDDNNMCI